MTSFIARLLLAAAVVAAARPADAAKRPERRETVVDASFELILPAGWAAERRAGGAVLTGPSAEGVPALISVRHVGPDHALYGTAAAYMKRLTRPSSIPMKGWKNGPVLNMEAAGRKALRLERDTTEFTDPHTIAPKEVAMREEHLALPAVPEAHGFYLLIYTAPRSIDKAQRAVFRALVAKGFKPKL